MEAVNFLYSIEEVKEERRGGFRVKTLDKVLKGICVMEQV